jgi:HK97 family phage major capsid protein
MEELKKQIAELYKALESIQAKLAATPNDGVKKDELEKVASETAAKLVELQKQYDDLKTKLAVPTINFGSKKDEVTFHTFMKMLQRGDQRLKTIVSVNETTAADGGIAVPTAFMPIILETMLNASVIAPLCTDVPMGTWKVDVPNQLVDVSVAWVAENGTVVIQVPTLGKITLQLGKLSAVIPFSDEQLMDQQVDLSSFYQKRIGLKFGQSIDSKVLEGNTGASPADLAMGIKNHASIGSVTYDKPITPDNIIDLMNSQTIEAYHANANWAMNRACLGILLKLRDNAGRALFGGLVEGVPTTLLGKPMKFTDQMTGSGTSASKTWIAYGDFSNVWLLSHSKFPNMTVEMSNSAVAPAVGTPTQNAFLNGQKWFRYDLRKGYIIAVPAAFKRGLDVFK